MFARIKRSATIAVACLALALTACEDQATQERVRAQAQAAAAEQVQAITDDLTRVILQETPELASIYAVDPALAGGPYQARLSDLSPAGYKRLAAAQAAVAQEMENIDAAALSAEDRATYDVLAATLRHITAGASFGYGVSGSETPKPYVVSQLDGAYRFIPDFLASVHPIATKQDADDYLARLQAFAVQLDQETQSIRADAETGVIPPAFILDATIARIDDLSERPAPATLLVRSLQERAHKAKGVTPVAAADMTREAISIVRDQVQPALRRQADALRSLRPSASDAPSVARLPNGESYYRTALAAWTTSTLSPDEVHRIGLELVASTTARLDALLDAQGLTEGTPAERIQALYLRSDQLYPDTSKGKAALIADLNQHVQAITARLPEAFSTLPQAPIAIRAAPAAIEAGGPAGYYQAPAPDGSRSGAYFIQLDSTQAWPRFTLPTLTFHEAVPGHHLAASIAQQSDLPVLRTSILRFGGYDEGWALYAEQLADELGMYENDPLGRIGYLQSMALRAARLVVDTGLHAKGWSRRQAVDYMISVTGDGADAIGAEIDRYIVWPGQACAYMVGLQTFNRLRESARSALGARFDLRGFHDAVLRDGPAPLSVVEARVDAWVSARKAEQ
jgi:uncharacterized protein (DUF885 family)